MRKYLLAAAAVAALSSPVAAQPYLGLEGGIFSPKDLDGDVRVDFTTTQSPTTPSAGAGPADFTFNDANGIDYKRGTDLDIILGYDFGFFRLEAEASRKRARLDDSGIDNGFLTGLNSALNRPSAFPDPGAPGLAPLGGADFNLDGRAKVVSIMGNALLDFGIPGGLSFYAGGGLGRARVRMFRDDARAWAGQAIAGVRYAVTPNIDVGLKYRYFRTGKVSINDSRGLLSLAGNPNRTTVGTTAVNQTTTARTFTDVDQKFRSHSLLASLIFNFNRAEPVIVAAPPPPPAPVEVAPATQTCADGSVILATDICPAPPPPPMPAPAPERG